MYSEIIPGTIVILNGPSASGKSSVQRALQSKISTFYIRMGIDSFFDALIAEPDLSSFVKTQKFEQRTNKGELIRRVELKYDMTGKQIVPLEIGSAGNRIISGMHHAIAAYAMAGNNIVVDYILYKTLWIDELVSALQNFIVYLIGFKTPLDIIEEREQKRATSPIGHARSHFHLVHTGMIYDMEIDTSHLSSDYCADQIIDFIVRHPTPDAFKQLTQIRNNQC